MILPALAISVALASPARCPIPRSAMMVMESDLPGTHLSVLATFDLADGSETCELKLPGGPVAVAQDGMIFAAIQAEKQTRFTTDAGHLDVFSPDGRLLHRVFDGMEGIDEIALDNRGHLFVSTGWPTFVNGMTVSSPQTLTMYDANSLTKIRTYPLEANFQSYALSPDGRVLALCYAFGANVGHVDLLDASTGERVRRIDTPAERASFESNTLLVWSQRGMVEIRLPDGAVRPSSRQDFANASSVVDGVEYTLVHGSVRFTGRQFTMTQTFTRRRLSDGTMLKPIVGKGLDGAYFIVHPNPQLAFATPGPELAPPVFPIQTELRASVGAQARGIAFDDTASGRHYFYLGDLARIDSDDEHHTRTLVDCTRGVAVVADTILKTYRVFAMDRLPVIMPTPQPTFGPEALSHMARFAASLDITPTDRAQWHSPIATIGYTETLRAPLPGAGAPLVVTRQREYAVVAAPLPSCSARTFGGEPSGIDPNVPSSVDMFFTAFALYPQLVHVQGSLPPVPSGAMLVYAEGSEPGKPAKTTIDIPAIRPHTSEGIAQFAIPNDYTELPPRNY